MKNLCMSLVALSTVFLYACDDDNTSPNDQEFRVVIENVSVNNTLPTSRIDGTIPLSHGVYAIMASGDLFTMGQTADAGTSRIAEDGFTTEKTNSLNNQDGVRDHGEFVAPGGPDNGAALFAGETSTFMISARPGDKLQIQTMFVQSNDWFYAFGNGGLDLFNGNDPITGNVTSDLVLYDAGTEIDEVPGVGIYQKPAQGPLDMNFGPADATTTITQATVRHTQFTIPATASVIRVTITPQD